MQILDDFLENIANAIRKRKQTTDLIKATDFASEIESIPQSSTGVFQTKEVNITSNGTTTITPDEGYDGMSKATITTNVQPTLQTKSTTLTSTSATSITPDSGYYGLSKVTVTPKLQAKTANCTSTSAVTLTPDSGYAGLSSAKVTPVTETRTHNVTANGTTTVSVNSGKVGMTKVTVNTSVYRTIANSTVYHNSGSFYSGIGVTVPAGVTTAKVIMTMIYPSGYNFYPQCTTSSGTISTTYDSAPTSGSYVTRTTIYTLSKSSSVAATVTMKMVASESYHVMHNSGVVIY